MIWNVLINFVLGILNLILGILPSADTNTLNFINNNLTGFMNLLATSSWFLPIDTFLTVLRMIITIEATLLGARLLVWGLTKTHILGGH